jgi:alkylation response protein AidB-like acyl-CoA dehydrogenase
MNGKKPGPDASIGKLFWSEYHKEITELAIDVLGADALTPSGTPAQTYIRPDAVGSPNSSASWVDVFMNARAGTIYAGSSQVQRGIVGEQILGLPKEPRADAGPWKSIPGHA